MVGRAGMIERCSEILRSSDFTTKNLDRFSFLFLSHRKNVRIRLVDTVVSRTTHRLHIEGVNHCLEIVPKDWFTLMPKKGRQEARG